MSRTYGDGNPSQVGVQINTHYYARKALIELKKEEFFMPLADVTTMPKNHGKKIKRYHYMPLLDDRNVNDQGIDAAGVTIANGNLYGSSKDIGTITSKLPQLSEAGGRVNRVGFTRLDIEGTFENWGFFDEYTQDSIDFDTDSELMSHINREMLRGAYEISEDMLQIDLINAAGTVRFPGTATAIAEITGESGSATEVTYEDLMRLSIDLDNNRTPKHTKIIAGSRLTDTKTIAGARVLYCGTEMIPTLKAMKDLHNNPAFIPVQHYADAGTLLNGEIGSIDQFRIVIVPEMQVREGEGATVTSNGGYRFTGSNYDVVPMLVVGDQSFTTIGFKTDGKSAKYQIIHKPPGKETADKTDPYGKTGFMSIQWWYGFMALRPERIAILWTVARL